MRSFGPWEMSDWQMLKGIRQQSGTAVSCTDSGQDLHKQTQDGWNLGVPETHHCPSLASQSPDSRLHSLEYCVRVAENLGKQAAD